MDKRQYAEMMAEMMRMSMNDMYKPFATRPERTQTDALEHEIRYLRGQIQDMHDMLRQERQINQRLRRDNDALHGLSHRGPNLGRINLTDLIKLCHPDRHDNSPLANAITQELIILRKR